MKKLLVILLFFSLPLAAEVRIETIELQSRLASELLPQLQPFIPGDATLSAHDNLLILKADSATRRQIKQLVTQLDQRLESVNVTVMRSTQQLHQQHQSSNRFDIDVTDPSQSSAEIRRWSTRDSRERDQQYQARGIEGRPISLQLGQLIPQQEQLILISPHGGVVVGESTEYIPVESGFQAVVDLLGDQQVRVELYPHFAEFDRRDRSIAATHLTTTLQGQLNQWILVGQLGEQTRQQGNKVYRSHRDEQQFIYLKIETQ